MRKVSTLKHAQRRFFKDALKSVLFKAPCWQMSSFDCLEIVSMTGENQIQLKKVRGGDNK
jgi:hypothetical protein